MMSVDVFTQIIVLQLHRATLLEQHEQGKIALAPTQVQSLQSSLRCDSTTHAASDAQTSSDNDCVEDDLAVSGASHSYLAQHMCRSHWGDRCRRSTASCNRCPRDNDAHCCAARASRRSTWRRRSRARTSARLERCAGASAWPPASRTLASAHRPASNARFALKISYSTWCDFRE